MTTYEIEEDSDAILSFKKDYGFLSNFRRSLLTVDGQDYPTLEHAFHALKTLDPAAREMIRNKANPKWAKEAARSKYFIVQEGWDSMKVGVMRELLMQKFTRHPKLREKLLATGDRLLAEGNTWSDRFWGVCQDAHGVWRGQNVLGALLMEVRAALASEKSMPKEVDNTDAIH